MIALRSATFQLLFYGWTGLVGIVLLPVLALPRWPVVHCCRFWCRGVMWLLEATVGLTYRVEGRENVPPGTAVFAVKHQSAWETFVIPILIGDPAIVLKRELLRIPFFGWLLWKHGMIAIDREAGPIALRQLVADAKAKVREGRSIVMYPEGTRTEPGVRRPFLPGIAALYKRLELPLIPVALNSGVFWSRRAFIKYSGCITLRFLPPVPPGLGRQEFMETLEDRIEVATEGLVESARKSLDSHVAGGAPEVLDKPANGKT